eukprot:CAMPEP_0197182310 /NCGR_PEP_ID=MMETSP1423-20130617/6310_1 /TAXON_ID=476441 /ORGANISM="Pseudo-nitzschia heimii, Strain UNC1101" /LENGTH=148 /DNA_ID=CAMNT_0042632719 /DNA_START=787 /DNA_END=1233 /DNA_ORIENTATION=+
MAEEDFDKREEARSSYVYSEGEIEEVMPDYEDEILDDEGEEEVIEDQREAEIDEVLDEEGEDVVEEEFVEVEDEDVTDDEDGVIESIKYTDGSRVLQVNDDSDGDSESVIEESDMFTEVTAEEGRNTDDSQTATETTEDVSSHHRAGV